MNRPSPHTATCCNMLQHATTHCTTRTRQCQDIAFFAECVHKSRVKVCPQCRVCRVMASNALQCVAVCCSVLQCVAVCCSALQCVAVCCRHSLVGRLCRICIATESAGLCVTQCARKSRARVCPECITTLSYISGMTHSCIMLELIDMFC